MPRRNAAIKRTILPDPLYDSQMLAKFINVVMRRGKKSRAENIVYQALVHLTEKLDKDKQSGSQPKKAGGSTSKRGRVVSGANPRALELLEKAFNNIRPTVEVKSRRVGGATYQVPIEVDPNRGVALAMRWVVKAASGRSEKTMVLRLAAELVDACEERGTAVKMRDDMHRMAKANQAFAHYRW